MPNRRQFVRERAAVLLACVLFVGLVPDCAAAQDLSTVEARTAWVIEQRRGESIPPNAKFGAATALARLALNPKDAEVIDRITHFYDRVPEEKNGQQFTYPGVAWVLGKYWDKFTPAQRDHLKAKLKGFSDLLGHGTENHAIMKCVAAYLFAQYWPNDTRWVRGTKTSAEVGETARGRLLAVMRSLYDKSYEENLSHNYAPVHLYPYYALYDCATDPEVKTAAEAALTFHVANMAANHFEGVTIPPANRDYPNTTWNTYTFEPGKCHASHLIHWFYWADAQNWTPAEIDRSDGNFVVYAALSSWRPPAAIESLARGQTVPYELTAAACSFGHAGVSPGFWGTGTPAECVRYVYRDKLYAMGSGFFQYYPEEFYVDYTAFRLIYQSPDRFNFIECYHPYWRSDDRTWQGLNSPFMQMAQHKGTAIALFNIPTADPWKDRSRVDWRPFRDGHYDNLIQESLVRYPKSIDQKTEKDGWIFLREGDVYIAIRPLKAYTIDADYSQAGEEFNVVRSAFAQTGFIFDLATEEEFATFAAFQSAANQKPPVVDWERLSVTYKSLKGDTLTATWKPTKYDVPKGQRVLVRPDITVNGAVVSIDSDFINGRAVMKSPSVELVNRVLRLRTPGGSLQVDWRGKVPAFAGDGNEWPQFRGPGGSGIAQDPESRGVPTEWDTTKNVAWRIDVPGLGWSSPIVWGSRVFLTTAVDTQGTEQPEGGFYLGKDRGGRGEHRWLVLAYDLNTGAKFWERQVHQAVPPRTHLKSSYASATPVMDGERVYAWFGEFGLLVALNAADGEEVWSFSEPPRKSRENWGFGASPVMHGGRIYLVHDNEQDAYVAAFDASSGKEIWRAKRPPETNWSTPLVWQNDQRTELVVAATGGVTSYDLNGRPLWEMRGMSRITVPNPVAGNGMVYVGSGFVADRQKPLYAIRPGAAGDISLKEGQTKNRYVAWVQKRAAPYVPSFLVAGKYLYVIKDNGQLSCYDAVTGTLVYQERLRGHFTASPWMCGDRLFFLNERGDTYVVQSGPTFRLLATNTLEKLCLATPAVAGDRLLIRTSSRLYCIGSDQ